jgi:putative hydrolase of the HAD superfamily
MYKNIIFDMDDTLMPCGPFYTRTQEDFGYYQHFRTGLDEKVCKDVLKNIDLTSIVLPGSFNRERFPRSFRAASYVLDTILGRELDQRAAYISYSIGDSVFDAPYILFEGVYDMLAAYQNSGFQLFLFTKGDQTVQREKILRNSLEQFFPDPNVMIVDRKHGGLLSNIVAERELTPDETIVVGDSLRDDVGSAHQAGLHSVWVQKTANKSWAYENTENHLHATYVIDYVTKLPTVIPVE